jgi:2-succinyl-5-enolpyruvyl-6-hydroxy-3-cyclohexene-1-carboxylate synthase
VSGADATTAWARAFVDELARVGVREVVVAPGSRSTPLVLAFAGDGRFRVRVHLDERSAGFFALGVGKASGMPAAVVTTSGTATANLHGAVIEAAQGEAPLLVLTADRPHRLRGADANQAIDQTRLYGPHVRAFFEVAPPTLEGPALRHLRTLAARAVLAAREAPAGPVHVNFPFDKPLEPAAPSDEAAAFASEHPLAAGGRGEARPFVAVAPARRVATQEELGRLRATLAAARRGVVVAGPSAEPDRDGPAATALASAAGFPLLADPLSGARFGPSGGALVVGEYDLILREGDVRARLAPDLVVRTGASPTSAALQRWLEDHNGVTHVVLDGGGRWKDHASVATHYVRADAADALHHLAGEIACDADPSWADAWRRCASVTRGALAADARGEPHEGHVLATVASSLPAGTVLFVSSSMPVRDLDAFGPPREDALRVLGNRGASGIDGIVSTAFGVSAASGGDRPVVCVLGDVALFHDQNGLLWQREPDARVVFVLVDNDGGGIFHMLPVRDHEPHFTRLFATPHGLDFRHAAALHGISLRDVDAAGLGAALTDALAAGRTCILRVRGDRDTNARRHREVAEAVARSVRAALG